MTHSPSFLRILTASRQLRGIALAGLLTITCASSFGGDRPDQSTHPFLVIAYVHGGSIDIEKYPLRHLTHVNYCFLRLSGNRLVTRGARDSIGISRLVALKTQYPSLKVMLSVGGWGGCEPCSDVFSTADGRHEFAVSVKELLDRYGADGIDLDWEYPAVEGYPGHKYADADREHFTLLVRELRSVLGKKYEITFAAGAFTKCLRESIQWSEVMPVVDYVNLMTYDFVNGMSTTTGHHTPLFSTPGQMESTDNAVRLLDSMGVPRQKIVIGAAFYARVWENVENVNNGLFQPGKFKTYVRFKQLTAFLDTSKTIAAYWDSTAQAPYAFDATTHLFATFDDRRSVALKTQYALDAGLGGIMFWELTGDTIDEGLLGVIAETVRNRVRQR